MERRIGPGARVEGLERETGGWKGGRDPADTVGSWTPSSTWLAKRQREQLGLGHGPCKGVWGGLGVLILWGDEWKGFRGRTDGARRCLEVKGEQAEPPGRAPLQSRAHEGAEVPRGWSGKDPEFSP